MALKGQMLESTEQVKEAVGEVVVELAEPSGDQVYWAQSVWCDQRRRYSSSKACC